LRSVSAGFMSCARRRRATSASDREVRRVPRPQVSDTSPDMSSQACPYGDASQLTSQAGPTAQGSCDKLGNETAGGRAAMAFAAIADGDTEATPSRTSPRHRQNTAAGGGAHGHGVEHHPGRGMTGPLLRDFPSPLAPGARSPDPHGCRAAGTRLPWVRTRLRPRFSKRSPATRTRTNWGSRPRATNRHAARTPAPARYWVTPSSTATSSPAAAWTTGSPGAAYWSGPRSSWPTRCTPTTRSSRPAAAPCR
jgi:hypothetical protein